MDGHPINELHAQESLIVSPVVRGEHQSSYDHIHTHLHGLTCLCRLSMGELIFSLRREFFYFYVLLLESQAIRDPLHMSATSH